MHVILLDRNAYLVEEKLDVAPRVQELTDTFLVTIRAGGEVGATCHPD